MEKLEEKIGYRFRNASLLKTALTHSSWANENKRSGRPCNERLEFLGDSVLGFIVAEYLYRTSRICPRADDAHARRAGVRAKPCGRGGGAGLGDYMRLGRGEELGGGRRRPSILADAFEAVVAAVYLDGGIGPAAEMVRRLILSGRAEAVKATCDYKTLLQEHVQKKSGQTLSYHMTGESGPDHMKQFSVEVRLNGSVVGTGIGKSKKEAEQAAARVALEALV